MTDCVCLTHVCYVGYLIVHWTLALTDFIHVTCRLWWTPVLNIHLILLLTALIIVHLCYILFQSYFSL